jgi:hypothetical protein
MDATKSGKSGFRRNALGKRTFVLMLAAVVAAGASVYGWDYTRLKTNYYVDYGLQRLVPYGIGEVEASTLRSRGSAYAIDSQRGKVVALRLINRVGDLWAPDAKFAYVEPWSLNVAKWEFFYDEEGQLESVHTYDSEGEPLIEAKVSFSKDEPVATVDFGPQNARGFVLRHRLGFDGRGRIVNRHFETMWGKAAPDPGGTFGRGYTYSDSGQQESIVNLDEDGAPTSDYRGIAGVRWTFTAGHELETRSWHAANGGLALNEQGFAKLALTRDNAQNNTGSRFLGSNGEAVVGPSGYARAVRKLDEHGNIVEEHYFGTDDQPILLKDEGFARMSAVFDEHGNLVEQRYFGTDDQPILKDKGFAYGTWAYDEHGNVVEGHYFGTNDQPILLVGGYAHSTSAYDEHGNLVEERYFGTDDQPMLWDGGYARFSRVFDEHGNRVEERLFGTDDQPILWDGGYARISSVFDEHGNLVEERYFGVDDQPILRDGGYARISSVFDEHGNVVEQRFFGVDDQPILQDGGFARGTWTYDERGNAVEERTFEIDGQPAVGCAHKTWTYDEFGNNRVSECTRFIASAEADLAAELRALQTKREAGWARDDYIPYYAREWTPYKERVKHRGVDIVALSESGDAAIAVARSGAKHWYFVRRTDPRTLLHKTVNFTCNKLTIGSESSGRVFHYECIVDQATRTERARRH